MTPALLTPALTPAFSFLFERSSGDIRQAAVQAAAALHAKATHLISRNPKDFATLTIPVLTPDEFLRCVLLAE